MGCSLECCGVFSSFLRACSHQLFSPSSKKSRRADTTIQKACRALDQAIPSKMGVRHPNDAPKSSSTLVDFFSFATETVCIIPSLRIIEDHHCRSLHLMKRAIRYRCMSNLIWLRLMPRCLSDVSRWAMVLSTV